jgi:hypothetical protein
MEYRLRKESRLHVDQLDPSSILLFANKASRKKFWKRKGVSKMESSDGWAKKLAFVHWGSNPEGCSAWRRQLVIINLELVSATASLSITAWP